MIGGQRVLALIPARGGSKGVLRKNLATVGGQTLIERAVRSAQASGFVDRIVVTTDDPAIADEALRCGAEAPFLREAHLADDAAPMLDVVLDALGRITEGDWIVLLQPTSPLRLGVDIDAVLAAAMAAGSESGVSLKRAKAHPAWLWTMTEDMRVRPLLKGAQPTRRQDLETVYERSGAVFAFTRRWFIERRAFSDDDTVGCVIEDARSIDVDTALDLAVANALAESEIEEAERS